MTAGRSISGWRLPERNSYIQSAVHFPTNISTSWLQGAVGFKADLKSQNTLFHCNVLGYDYALLCEVTKSVKCLLFCFYI